MPHPLSLSSTKVLLGLGIWFLGFFGVIFALETYEGEDNCKQGDLMQQAYCLAHTQDTVIHLGYNKSAVGGAVFRWNTNMTIDFKSGIRLSPNDSTVIRITKFLLTLTIVLSVTMIIFNGMQYIIKSGNGEDPSKIRSNLVYIVVGIMVALFSVVLINLLRSTGTTLYKTVSNKTASTTISPIETTSLT